MAAFYADYVRSEDKDFIKETLNEIRNPVEVAVFGLKNYHNLGAIIRTGHSFLISGYWGIDCPDYYPKAAMTARPWEKALVKHVTLEEFLEKTVGRNIVCIEKDDNLPSEDMRTFSYPENPILVFGCEDFGIPRSILERSNAIVTIPMQGLVHSFNVSVAAGIALYDWWAKFSRKDVAK